MTFYYIIADSYDDFRDYLDRYEIPESDAKHFKLDNLFIPNRSRNKPMDMHFLHITKFAAVIDVYKVRFIDLQMMLALSYSNVKTCIETDGGVLVNTNVSFLKL